MGICQTKARPEILIGNNKQISIEITSKAIKSVCKIIIKNNVENTYGTGFFMKKS